MLALISFLLVGGVGPQDTPKWAVKVIPITPEWRLKVCNDSNDVVEEATTWVRLYHRAGQRRFRAAGRSRGYPTALGYPNHYEVVKIRNSSVRLIVSDCDTYQNCFYNVWSFQPETGSLKMVAHDLMNLDSDKATHGVLLESAGSQYVENHGGPGLRHMIARTWRYDPRHNRLVHGKWFNDPRFN